MTARSGQDAISAQDALSGLDPLSGQDSLSAHEERLLACVHCGLCLDACPTYTRLGDEADSPRGRIVLMRAVAEGRLDADAPAFMVHIDRCLGCRACEPVCPSGVQYGFLLERARATVRERAGRPIIERLVLAAVGSRPATVLAGWAGRLLRAGGLAQRLAHVLPRRWSRIRLALAMLAASRPRKELRSIGERRTVPARESAPNATPAVSIRSAQGTADRPLRHDSARGMPDRSVRTEPLRVALLEGCVQRALFGHVNAATRRVLHTNGCTLVRARGQCCCGALHAHGGDLDGARRLALVNIAAFERTGAERIVVNAAGCGAMMKEYSELFEGTPHAARALTFSERVRDVSELLADLGPVEGEAFPVRIAYDPPCHLIHAQRIVRTPLDVLERAIPELMVVPIERADECCGGAGTYGLSQGALASRILESKIRHVQEADAALVLTANTGCIMQIGAGLVLVRDETPVLHPIEVLDESYRRANRSREPRS